ncbi:sec-independent protein translocase protein TatA [Deinobacterium chartae]|uniref:Sec-independent protein translocase protein TatA n=1 Tax=Deinobacterium chartae TaxID=521158 RepID=A0A841I5C5_9DEIO|nr:twin-arginine translocase TatA/TatE family subunit [Deinobacterium chartae]MBB6099640.1 sec-independent protein translocase protein TatA [Deinobacterium chartae]
MNLGPAEVILILVAVLLIFGPKKLPELGKSLGQGIREFRRGTQGIREDLEASLKDEPKAAARSEAEPQAKAAAPAPALEAEAAQK